ncbi:MAG: hypothetical protein IKP95_00400 [Ruminococcus sp.]|nr:hypothetical protein [Ruminococcus sp.]
MKKHLLCLIAGAMILASCSSSESNSDGSDTPSGGSDNSFEIDLTATEARQAYKGAELLMGQAFEQFIMPDTFEIPQITQLYELTVNTAAADIDRERLQKLFSDFVGEGYDPQRFIVIGSDLGYMYSGEGENAAFCKYQGNSFLLTNFALFPDGEGSRNIWSGFTGINSDEVIDLGELQTSVGQQAAFFDKKLNELFEGILDPFEIKAGYFDVISDGGISADCALTLEGIPLQAWETGLQMQLASIDPAKRSGSEEYFANFGVSAVLLGGEQFGLISVSSVPRLLEKRELSSVISLQRAVGILQTELDNDTAYTFSDVSLMYTGLITAPPDAANARQQEAYAAEPVTLRPMWCFFIESGNDTRRDCIKVDAVTGEVILDL